MEQIERIENMEKRFDKTAAAVEAMSKALKKYMKAQADISALIKYYESEWRKDFSDDEAGLLPSDLKRGVLSEDGLWNLLDDVHELNDDIEKAAYKLSRKR